MTIKFKKEDLLWHEEKKVDARGEDKSFPVAEEEWAGAGVSALEESAFAPTAERKSPTSAEPLALK